MSNIIRELVSSDKPICFGSAYSATAKKCRTCPVQAACITQCQRWQSFSSLSQALDVAESALRISGDNFTLPQLYVKLYELHYGNDQTLDLPNGRAALEMFGWVYSFCSANDIDPAVWITAQMHGMKMFLDRQRETNGPCPYFRVNMLCGEKAKIRYNVYVRMSYRRYRRVAVDVFNVRTDIAQLCNLLAEDEERVGSFYCMNVVEGVPLSWRVCIDHAEVSGDWRALNQVPGMSSLIRAKALAEKYDSKTLDTVKRIATLRAAVAVSSRFSFDLADRIGFREPFSWNDFAMFLLRSYGGERISNKPKVSHLDGVEWRGSDV